MEADPWRSQLLAVLTDYEPSVQLLCVLVGFTLGLVSIRAVAS